MVPLDFQSFFAAKNHQAVLLPEKLALTGLLAVPLLDGSTFGSWAALALDQWEWPKIEDSLLVADIIISLLVLLGVQKIIEQLIPSSWYPRHFYRYSTVTSSLAMLPYVFWEFNRAVEGLHFFVGKPIELNGPSIPVRKQISRVYIHYFQAYSHWYPILPAFFMVRFFPFFPGPSGFQGWCWSTNWKKDGHHSELPAMLGAAWRSFHLDSERMQKNMGGCKFLP